MNKRLIWNFEVNSSNPLQISEEPDEIQDGLHWEKRFFWSQNTIICLQGLPEDCLKLSNYKKIKAKIDHYYLLPDSNYNLKERREKLQYKPLLIHTDNLNGYGKKINFDNTCSSLPQPQHASLNTNDLLQRIQDHGEKISVEKETLMYRFPTNIPIKLELARLMIDDKIYFSACVESQGRRSVELISTHLFGDTVSSDYVTFLKSISGKFLPS